MGFDAADISGTGTIGVDDLTQLLGITLDPEHIGERWDVIMSELTASVRRKGEGSD